jgi:hypothetical protein
LTILFRSDGFNFLRSGRLDQNPICGHVA